MSTTDLDLLVIVDDNSTAFSYSWTNAGSITSYPWLLNTLPFWYNGTMSYWTQGVSSVTQRGTITFTFDGTSAAFFGIFFSPETATVQIDSQLPFVLDYRDRRLGTYLQWFTTPTLSDGRHTVTINDLYNSSIDYAVVKVGNQTSLAGKTIIVDDDSPLIQYSGQWTRNTSAFTSSVLFTQYAYGNGTHRSSNPGDSFTFRFTGISIIVYGVSPWNSTGSLAATYSLDGVPYTPSPISYFVTGEITNHPYISLGNLYPGTHTLSVVITQAENRAFTLDYITYIPSFDTRASMPSLPMPPLSSMSSPSSTPSGISSGTTGSAAPTGAIVGGVLGGVAFGVLVTILILLILRRRRAREQNYPYNDANIRGESKDE